jgi:hypothetical protein
MINQKFQGDPKSKSPNVILVVGVLDVPLLDQQVFFFYHNHEE